LSMGEYSLSVSKAADKGIYLITRNSAVDPGSDFYSNDLKTLVPLSKSNIRSEGASSLGEVIRWKGFDGAELVGVLYRPENFVPGKKYPVRIEYYQNDGSMRVKSFESGSSLARGYVMFFPDVHYVFGETGPSAYNAVVSGAQQLAKLPFVDSAKMGINGHSFGGYETNFIVTHTNIFAAAVSSSGMSDLITLYGSYELDKQGFSQAATIETGQLRIGATPWERLDLYLKNSPIFSADQVTTPILLMANDHDLRVPVNQGVEFFKALRRLGKKAWMLQYDEGTHGAPDSDWGIRVDQFFDYYLKGSPPPKWMTEGIPARLKGIDSGLELDTSGAVP
jgi:dipeptidyl aminopeptidase/acylaminoacyl peptidase